MVVLLCAFSSLQQEKTARGFLHALNNSITQKLRIGPPQRVQGWTKRLFPGCVKFGEEVSYCLPSAGRNMQNFSPLIHATWEEPLSPALYSKASRVVCCALGALAPPLRLMRMKARVVKCYGNNEGGSIAAPKAGNKRGAPREDF